MEKFKISEIFFSIEGEGIRSGELAAFIRLYGCNLNCSYCDTRYACDEGENFYEMSTSEIVSKIISSGYNNVTITGGEPLIHTNIEKLMNSLFNANLKVNIETNGSIDITGLNRHKNLFFTCDYKCPSSGMSDKMYMQNLNNLQENDVLKFVVQDVLDLKAALKVINEYRPKCHIYFSPVFKKIEPKQIVEFMKDNQLTQKVRLQLQLHKYIYPHDERGV